MAMLLLIQQSKSINQKGDNCRECNLSDLKSPCSDHEYMYTINVTHPYLKYYYHYQLYNSLLNLFINIQDFILLYYMKLPSIPLILSIGWGLNQTVQYFYITDLS